MGKKPKTNDKRSLKNATNQRYKTGVYMSNYKRGSYAKSLRPCEVCGTIKEMTARGKYCSNACKMRARNEKKKAK